MSMDSERYGLLSGAEDADALAGLGGDGQSDPLPEADSPLWSYHNQGRINGVPVAEGDRDLKIDDERLLAAAFALSRRTRSLMLYLSPDGGDGSEEYGRLLDRMNGGAVEIIDEIRQWDAEHSRFVLWVRYNELEYRLHPRFSYLKEE